MHTVDRLRLGVPAALLFETTSVEQDFDSWFEGCISTLKSEALLYKS
jgi:hypothetical protein